MHRKVIRRLIRTSEGVIPRNEDNNFTIELTGDEGVSMKVDGEDPTLYSANKRKYKYHIITITAEPSDFEYSEVTLSIKPERNDDTRIGTRVRLLPVEVIDKDNVVINELNIGKMEDAIDESSSNPQLKIEDDIDHFKIRIRGAANLFTTICKVG